MLEAGINYSIFFYNPNIHPVKEYEIRKNENIRFAEQHGIELIDADYDVDNWFDRIKGLENEPERGERCTKCFDMRFERTALYAHEHGFDTISSSLGISRWKDMNQINGCGERAAARYDDLVYWTTSKSTAVASIRFVTLTAIDDHRDVTESNWVSNFMANQNSKPKKSLGLSRKVQGRQTADF